MKKARAFTIIEFMLVLSLAVVLTLMAARQYTKYIQQKNIATLNNSVQLLLLALKAYYAESNDGNPAYCDQILTNYTNHQPWQQMTPVSISTLAASGFLTNPGLIQNPFAGEVPLASQSTFNLAIDTQSFPFTLQVTVSFPKVMNINQFQAIAAGVHPTSINYVSSGQSTMQWVVPTTYLLQAEAQGIMPLDTSLEQFSVDQLNERILADLPISNFPCSVIEHYLYKQTQP